MQHICLTDYYLFSCVNMLFQPCTVTTLYTICTLSHLDAIYFMLLLNLEAIFTDKVCFIYFTLYFIWSFYCVVLYFNWILTLFVMLLFNQGPFFCVLLTLLSYCNSFMLYLLYFILMFYSFNISTKYCY